MLVSSRVGFEVASPPPQRRGEYLGLRNTKEKAYEEDYIIHAVISKSKT
jgi:hypothetical protein